MVCAICLSFWLLVHFGLYGVLDSGIKISKVNVIFMVLLYFNIFLNWLYPRVTCALLLLACFFMIEVEVSQFIQTASQHQNRFGLGLLLVYIIMQFSEAMQTEADYMIDSIVMALTLITYLITTRDQPKCANPWCFATIVVCSKLSYFLDREKSLNF